MFKKIFVEITNRCNLACHFCPVTRRKKGDLESADFAALLPQLTPFTKHLALHVLGEPLLHPHLAQILGLCHNHGLRVNLTTNGTLLPLHGRTLLAAEALRQINISLHSVSGSNRGLDHDGYLGGVLEFARQAAARGIFVSLRIWDGPSAPAETGGRRQDELLCRLEEFFGIAASLPAVSVAGQGRQLADKIFLSQKELFAWPKLSGPDCGGQGSCRGLRDHIAILVDGTVVPCCLDAEGTIPLGNVFNGSFAGIVAGERAVRIKQGFQERKMVEELCRRCSYRQRF